MAFYNIAGLDWSEVAMVGWFGVNCESSETDQRLKWGGGHDHGEGELRAIWKEGRWELEESKMLCRILTFFRKEIVAFYPSVCQIGNSSEKSEL